MERPLHHRLLRCRWNTRVHVSGQILKCARRRNFFLMKNFFFSFKSLIFQWNGNIACCWHREHISKADEINSILTLIAEQCASSRREKEFLINLLNVEWISSRLDFFRVYLVIDRFLQPAKKSRELQRWLLAFVAGVLCAWLRHWPSPVAMRRRGFNQIWSVRINLRDRIGMLISLLNWNNRRAQKSIGWLAIIVWGKLYRRKRNWIRCWLGIVFISNYFENCWSGRRKVLLSHVNFWNVRTCFRLRIFECQGNVRCSTK